MATVEFGPHYPEHQFNRLLSQVGGFVSKIREWSSLENWDNSYRNFANGDSRLAAVAKHVAYNSGLAPLVFFGLKAIRHSHPISGNQGRNN